MAGTVLGEKLATDPAVIEADPAAQAAITAFVHAQNEDEREESFQRLEEMAGPSYGKLVRQLVTFSCRADNVRDGMACGVLVRRLGIPDRAVIEAVIPLLQGEDAALAKSSRNILAGFEHRSAGRRPDFSVYREIIADGRRAGQNPPMGLIRYMYQAEPGEAMLTLMRSYQLREPEVIKTIVWAEHVVSDVLWKQRNGFLGQDEIEPAAAVELANLSRHPEGWVRLYAAETMRQHWAFRRPQLMVQLSNDDHILVRSAASTAEAPH